MPPSVPPRDFATIRDRRLTLNDQLKTSSDGWRCRQPRSPLCGIFRPNISLTPVVEDIEPRPAVAPIVRPVHRDALHLGAEAARDHMSICLLAGEVDPR